MRILLSVTLLNLFLLADRASAQATSIGTAVSCSGTGCASSGQSGGGSSSSSEQLAYVKPYVSEACTEIRLRCGASADPAPDAEDWARCKKLRPTCKRQVRRYQALQRRLKASRQADRTMDQLEVAAANSVSAWETYKVKLESVLEDLEANMKNPCNSKEYFEAERTKLKAEYEKIVQDMEPKLGRIRADNFASDVATLTSQLQAQFSKTRDQDREEAKQDRLEFLKDIESVGQDAQAVIQMKTKIELLSVANQAPEGTCQSTTTPTANPSATGSNVLSIED